MRNPAILVVAMILCGCDRQAARPSHSKPDPLGIGTSQSVSNTVPTWDNTKPFTPPPLSSVQLPSLSDLTEKVETLEKNQGTLFRRTLSLEQRDRSVSITPEQKEFQTIDAGFVTLLVLTENVEPYLDGYKIKLKIGNPTSADLATAELVCTTFKTSGTNTSYEFLSNWRSVTNSIPGRLSAAAWTPIEFVLAPATIEEVRNATVSLAAKQVFLREALPKER